MWFLSFVQSGADLWKSCGNLVEHQSVSLNQFSTRFPQDFHKSAPDWTKDKNHIFWNRSDEPAWGPVCWAHMYIIGAELQTHLKSTSIACVRVQNPVFGGKRKVN
jgi:hypothetical protein